MLTIQPIMNSIDGTNGKQSDDFQSANFNADDDFGDFADFQDNNKIVDDDFGDFTFFQSSTNVNNSSNCNNTTTNQTTMTTTTTTTTNTTTAFNVNGFKQDNIETVHRPNYQLLAEAINDGFGDFTIFQSDNCDNNKQNSEDDEFGDFSFFESHDQPKLAETIDHQAEEKDNNTNGDVNFFSSSVMSNNDSKDDKLDESLEETSDSNNKDQSAAEDNEEEDDFGDFADFQETSPVVVKSDGFTKMSNPIMTKSQPSSSSQTVIPSSTPKINCDPDNCLLPSNSPLTSIVCQSFAKDIQNGGNKVISTDLFANPTSQSYKMWQSLINWEEAASLKLNWESSHTFQVFLRSLKIDSRNIQQMPGLRNISTPLIPSKLILQPTPLLPSIVPLEPQVTQQSHQLTVSSDSLNNSLEMKNQEQSASSIPEASFDWNSSGLTNPLEKDWLILL